MNNTKGIYRVVETKRSIGVDYFIHLV